MRGSACVQHECVRTSGPSAPELGAGTRACAAERCTCWWLDRVGDGRFSCLVCTPFTRRCPPAQVLFELCRFRNHHPAFNGTFELLDTIQDILDSTMIVPGTTADGPATTPIPMPGAPAVPSERGGDTGELGASGSFAAQRVSLLASIDGEEADFLADIVLDRSSIDVLASMDRGDLEDGTIWCASWSSHYRITPGGCGGLPQMLWAHG